MVLNLGILAYIILLAYWLGAEGFFSSLLHLGLVIVSGALAFAFWEPISIGMLSGMTPRFAAAIGLIIPFFVFLLLLRIAMDRLVRVNMDFSAITNLIGGGILGVIAASLSAGIFMIGISRLPTSEDLFGVKPYIVKDNGEIGPDPAGGSLWVPVDDWAAGFFTMLSTGSFHPANDMPLGKVRPDFVRVGHLNRLRSDHNSSTVASPDAVKITSHEVHLTPVTGLPPVFGENLPKHGSPTLAEQLAGDKHKVVVVDTEWTNAPDSMVYDGGEALRVYPTQMLLLAYSPDEVPTLHSPVAFSRVVNKVTREREFTPVSDHRAVAKELSTAGVIYGWVYIIPREHVARYMFIRDRRFELENWEARNKVEAQKPESVAALIGKRVFVPAGTVATNTNTTPKVGEKEGGRSNVKAKDIELTSALPAVTSRNLAPSLVVTDKNEVRSGVASVQPPDGPISRALLINSVHTPEGQHVVRVRLERDLAQSLLGHSVASAGALHPLFIRDNAGNDYQPIGYVWKQLSGVMNISIDPAKLIQAVTQLPYRKMGDGDELYVYFLVKRGVRLQSIHVGTVHRQDIDGMDVPK